MHPSVLIHTSGRDFDGFICDYVFMFFPPSFLRSWGGAVHADPEVKSAPDLRQHTLKHITLSSLLKTITKTRTHTYTHSHTRASAACV